MGAKVGTKPAIQQCRTRHKAGIVTLIAWPLRLTPRFACPSLSTQTCNCNCVRYSLKHVETGSQQNVAEADGLLLDIALVGGSNGHCVSSGCSGSEKEGIGECRERVRYIYFVRYTPMDNTQGFGFDSIRSQSLGPKFKWLIRVCVGG